MTPNSPTEDHECLMHDPITGYLYIVQKNHDGANANIYKFYPEAGGISVATEIDLVGKAE